MNEEKTIVLTSLEMVETHKNKIIDLLKLRGMVFSGYCNPIPAGSITQVKCFETGDITIKQNIK